jgi:hypothetical protein
MLRLIIGSLLLAGAANAAAQSQLDQPAGCDTASADAYKVLFIGDSITRHGFNAVTTQKLGWSHLSGMAASNPQNDYVTILARKISVNRKQPVISCFHTYGGSGEVSQRLAAMDQVSNTNPDLVVIQLGEHEKELNGQSKLAVEYQKLIQAAKKIESGPNVIAVGPWSLAPRTPTGDYFGWPGVVDETMQSVALFESIPYATVRDISALPEASGWGSAEGVKWHPNDLGHTIYAERIYRLYLRANKPR